MSNLSDLRTWRSRAQFWMYTACLFFGMSCGLVASMLSMSTRVVPADLVYEVCNESRISIAIKEDGCADLQDQLHMEFLCEQNNISPTNHCWVEEK
jgi:hypothetical protein